MNKAKLQVVFPAEKETIRFTPDPNPTGAPEGETVEHWATKNKTEEWLFCAAKALKAWPIGKVIQEPEYLSAIDQAGKVELRLWQFQTFQ